MRTHRKEYRDPKGRKRQAERWYIELRIGGKARRVAGFVDKARSIKLGEFLERVALDAAAGISPDARRAREFAPDPTPATGFAETSGARYRREQAEKSWN